MKTTWTPTLFFTLLLFIGCKSGQEAFQSANQTPINPSFTKRLHRTSPPGSYSITNVYYQFDKGPGCAYFFSQSDYEQMHMSGGTKVIVINGHFSPLTEMPPSRIKYETPFIPNPPRALDLIDTTPLTSKAY